MVVNDSDIMSFYDYLISKGYYFNKELIENYLLSLKVKPFVILTGNSGTGKTKLSQLFAKYIDNSNNIKLDRKNFIFVSVKSNESSWKNNGWTLSPNDFIDVFPIKECQVNFKMNVDGISAEGNLYPTVQLYYDNETIQNYFLELYENDKNKLVQLKIDCNSLNNLLSGKYMETDGSITLKQNANKSAYNDRQWLANYNIYNYVPFERGYVPCNIIVNDIKAKGRIRILFKLSFKKNEVLQKYLKQNIGKEVNVEILLDTFNFENFKSKYSCIEFNSKKLSDDENNKYKIVPVGANWTDNANIIGYYNAITEEYQSTPTYDLINDSEKSNHPFFLILDEMNLSHVERYFADFLSAIESNEPIPIFGKSNKSLNIPNNLFIIGTVNVDETTYMFSPKVLDRANTIEFDTLPVSDYINWNWDDNFEGDIDYLQSPLVDSDISNLNILDLKEILSKISCSEGNLLEVLTTELNSFQYALKSSSFDFGFRVINEILRFMIVAWRYENSPDTWDNWERYFDAQIKQKILPKLHGSQKAIGNMLNDLFNLCLINPHNNEQARLFKLSKDNCKYYNSALKLQNMSKVLSDQRYVSFIN